MRRNGFTIIELMIVIAIIGILLSIIAPFVTGDSDRIRELSQPEQPTIVQPWQEPSKESCVGGYKVATVGSNSFQILDENGNGIKCEVEQ